MESKQEVIEQPTVPRPLSIFVDADACPVKDEVYKVATRHAMPVLIVANTTMRIPGGLVQMVVCTGFGAADDWIAEQIGLGDIAITADIPLAARCLARGARVIDARGNVFSVNNIAEALALREMLEERRQYGETTGGPPAMTPKDRSRFLSKLDETIHSVRKGRG
ncbi:MAG: YaiI/YqxD family protein [Gemmataceae bacterium]|nr:YaiI/YqxD family protein [Gemmataceae bacterium]